MKLSDRINREAAKNMKTPGEAIEYGMAVGLEYMHYKMDIVKERFSNFFHKTKKWLISLKEKVTTSSNT